MIGSLRSIHTMHIASVEMIWSKCIQSHKSKYTPWKYTFKIIQCHYWRLTHEFSLSNEHQDIIHTIDTSHDDWQVHELQQIHDGSAIIPTTYIRVLLYIVPANEP